MNEPQEDVVELTPYEQWKFDPTPDNKSRVVKELDPLIKSTLHQIGGGSNPHLYSQARLLASKAVDTYSPDHGASLNTWVSQQLMPLRRIRRESQLAVKVPESAQLDAYHLMRVEREFMDKHDREPDLEELADAANMPIRRIEKVRKQFVQLAYDDGVNQDMEEGGSPSMQVSYSTPDYETEALDYVYNDSDYADRKIIEHKLGYGGADLMSGEELAAMLKVSPAQITRRSKKLMYRLQQIQKSLERVG